MKKLLSIALLFIVLSGCKDNEPETDTSLIGSWTVTSQTIDYFNSSNVKIHTEPSGELKSATFDVNNNAVITSTDNSIENSGYSVASFDGKKYLLFENQNITDLDLELTFPTSSTMIWYAKETNVSYGSGSDVGAYAEYKVTFTKK